MPNCYTSRTAGCERKKYARKNIVGVMPSRLNHLAPDCDAHARQLLSDFKRFYYEFIWVPEWCREVSPIPTPIEYIETSNVLRKGFLSSQTESPWNLILNLNSMKSTNLQWVNEETVTSPHPVSTNLWVSIDIYYILPSCTARLPFQASNKLNNWICEWGGCHATSSCVAR